MLEQGCGIEEVFEKKLVAQYTHILGCLEGVILGVLGLYSYLLLVKE